jgi:transposase
MISEEARERMRRAYYLEKKTLRQIAREEGYSRVTIKRVISDASPRTYTMTKPRPAIVLGPYQLRVEELMAENEQLPRKQRYTSQKMYEILKAEGYTGSESRIRQYIGAWRHTHQSPKLFLPLEYDLGHDAQADWGEAIAVIGGVRQTVQFFVLRLSYSRRTFIMTFPSQNQESFLYAHVQAFNFFGGVPARISYDNLTTAVKLAMKKKGAEKGRKRIENKTFVTFRSHYLFESHFCTPRAGWEKGQVESMVGYGRRNYLVPIREAVTFDDLNKVLLERCVQDDARRVSRQSMTIGQAWEEEKPYLLPLPAFEYECCDTVSVHLTPYSQATYETNRYSVPVNRAKREVILKAYPFHIDIYDKTDLIARHPRSYEKEQDIFDPIHYLPLLEQRPGAFDYAKPLRRWKKDWPKSYHQMLDELTEKWPEGRGIQEFVRILHLHKDYPSELIEQAIEQALALRCVHLDGVLHCLRQLTDVKEPTASLDLSDRPDLDKVGNQPVDLSRYERLLKYTW